MQCSVRSAGVFAFGRIAEEEVRLDLFEPKAHQSLRSASHRTAGCTAAAMAECSPNAALADRDRRTVTVERRAIEQAGWIIEHTTEYSVDYRAYYRVLWEGNSALGIRCVRPSAIVILSP